MKYYVPFLNEFHVGFEYEVLQKGKTDPHLLTTFPVETEDKWYSYTFPDPFLGFRLDKMFETYTIRVKYLDEQDIKDLNLPDNVFVILENVSDVEIYINSMDIEHRHFSGTVKNKSELKRLLKQLGI